jgi:hypothetical protein
MLQRNTLLHLSQVFGAGLPGSDPQGVGRKDVELLPSWRHGIASNLHLITRMFGWVASSVCVNT